jgi:hypothetical protein
MPLGGTGPVKHLLVATAILASGVSSLACAQELTTRDETMAYIAEAVGRINSKFMPAYAAGSMFDSLLTGVLEDIDALRITLMDNPYARLRSFTVTISFPPSVSLDFDFVADAGTD